MKYVRVYYDWIEDRIYNQMETNTMTPPHLCEDWGLFCVTLEPSDTLVKEARELWKQMGRDLLAL